MATLKFNKIVLDEHFIIEPDGNNFTLIKNKPTGQINPKTNKEIISSDIWYPPTLKDALKSYLRESLRDCADVNDIIKRIDEVESKIDNLKFK